jgi:hypothetical protein
MTVVPRTAPSMPVTLTTHHLLKEVRLVREQRTGRQSWVRGVGEVSPRGLVPPNPEGTVSGGRQEADEPDGKTKPSEVEPTRLGSPLAMRSRQPAGTGRVGRTGWHARADLRPWCRLNRCRTMRT